MTKQKLSSPSYISTMTGAEIQARLDALPKLMNAAGFKDPNAYWSISANSASYGYVSWYEGRDYKTKNFPSIEELEKWVGSLPSREERDKRQFLQSLSDIIAKGQEIGIDVEYVNPLVETMRNLSSNIITHVKETNDQ